MDSNDQLSQKTFSVHQFVEQPMSIEKRVNLILREMEEGFRVNIRTLTDLKASCELTQFSFKKQIHNTLGKVIRVDSSKDLGDLFFQDLCFPSLRSTPKGKPSVTIDVLERLSDSYSDSYPFLRSVIELKKVQTLIKSVKTISKKLGLNSKIHPEFNHSTCPTGRIYSYIQNLPNEVRKVLIPDEEENVFIELDWSQQELRILAVLSQEPAFLDCFAKEGDLHKRVISEMFHKPVAEVINEERKVGKTINYALIYGQEAPGLAWKLNIPLKGAQELIDHYFFSLPTIRKFKEESRQKFLTKGYAETVFGRKTHLDLLGPNKEKELRRGFNHIIQGTGADILRMTLVRLSEALKGKHAKLKFCAHDSIYLEARKEDSEEAAKLARSVMEIAFMGVPLPVAIKTCHEFSMGEESTGVNPSS